MSTWQSRCCDLFAVRRKKNRIKNEIQFLTQMIYQHHQSAIITFSLRSIYTSCVKSRAERYILVSVCYWAHFLHTIRLGSHAWPFSRNDIVDESSSVGQRNAFHYQKFTNWPTKASQRPSGFLSHQTCWQVYELWSYDPLLVIIVKRVVTVNSRIGPGMRRLTITNAVQRSQHLYRWT